MQVERIRLNICGELADGSLQIAVVEELLCIHNWLTPSCLYLEAFDSYIVLGLHHGFHYVRSQQLRQSCLG